MNTQLLLQTDHHQVRRLHLNRPERKNALTRPLLDALHRALEEISVSSEVRVVILSGEGRSFCSGADLQVLRDTPEEDHAELLDLFHRLIIDIVQLPQPVIAAVDGPAVGFGADLALACDLRLFSESAYLEESFVQLGLLPDGGGTAWMPAFAGWGRAFEYLALGTRLDAYQCEQLGLISRVVVREQFEEVVSQISQQLAESAPLAIQAIKRAVRATQLDQLTASLQRERHEQLSLLRSADFREALQAFFEKRAPQFQGK